MDCCQPTISDLIFTMSCNFACQIALPMFVTGFFFGGKDDTGDGTPEGLPLICRFSYLTQPLLEREEKDWQLAPPCDGEPLSSSSLVFCIQPLVIEFVFFELSNDITIGH